MNENTKMKGIQQLSEIVRQQQVDITKRLDNKEHQLKKKQKITTDSKNTLGTEQMKVIPSGSVNLPQSKTKTAKARIVTETSDEEPAATINTKCLLTKCNGSNNISEWEVLPDPNQQVTEYTNHQFEGPIKMLEVVNVQKQVGENGRLLIRYSCGSVEWGDINDVWSDARGLITKYKKVHAKLFIDKYSKEKTEEDKKRKEEANKKKEETKRKKEEVKRKREEDAKKKTEDAKKSKGTFQTERRKRNQEL
jgi:hypothetical protein